MGFLLFQANIVFTKQVLLPVLTTWIQAGLDGMMKIMTIGMKTGDGYLMVHTIRTLQSDIVVKRRVTGMYQLSCQSVSHFTY